MKKRIIAAFAALSIALSAAGCGKSDTAAQTGNPEVTGDTSVSGKVVIYTSM